MMTPGVSKRKQVDKIPEGGQAMLASVRALLSGIIDYAGLFPPAKLPLDEAIRNYARYRTEPESWMLGRFICPAGGLVDLEPFLPELSPTGPPLTISALGRGGDTVADFISGLRLDLEIIADFRKKQGERARMDSVEVRLPKEIVDAAQKKQMSFADQLTSHWCEVAPGNLPIFYEVPFGQGYSSLIEGLGPIRWMGRLEGGKDFVKTWPRGIKIRCGGLEPSTFPAPEQLASAIFLCCKKAPLKATAGLHHPIRHFDAGVQAVMHGFINVFAAGVLAFADRLNEKEIQAIIEDQDPKNFIFDDKGLRWKTYRANIVQIEEARREFMTSFGSCSFDEPRDDLRALGWIP
jgi:hypothetical protein